MARPLTPACTCAGSPTSAPLCRRPPQAHAEPLCCNALQAHAEPPFPHTPAGACRAATPVSMPRGTARPASGRPASRRTGSRCASGHRCVRRPPPTWECALSLRLPEHATSIEQPGLSCPPPLLPTHPPTHTRARSHPRAPAGALAACAAGTQHGRLRGALHGGGAGPGKRSVLHPPALPNPFMPPCILHISRCTQPPNPHNPPSLPPSPPLSPHPTALSIADGRRHGFRAVHPRDPLPGQEGCAARAVQRPAAAGGACPGHCCLQPGHRGKHLCGSSSSGSSGGQAQPREAVGAW